MAFNKVILLTLIIAFSSCKNNVKEHPISNNLDTLLSGMIADKGQFDTRKVCYITINCESKRIYTKVPNSIDSIFGIINERIKASGLSFEKHFLLKDSIVFYSAFFNQNRDMGNFIWSASYTTLKDSLRNRKVYLGLYDFNRLLRGLNRNEIQTTKVIGGIDTSSSNNAFAYQLFEVNSTTDKILVYNALCNLNYKVDAEFFFFKKIANSSIDITLPNKLIERELHFANTCSKYLKTIKVNID